MKKSKLVEFFERFILLRDLSFMKKLIVFSSLLVIIPVLSVGIISYERSAREIEKEVKQSSNQVIEQVESHIEYYLRDFDITSLKIMKNPEVTYFFLSNPDMQEKEKKQASVRNFFKVQEYSRPDISNITLIFNSGDTIDTLGELNYYPVDNIKKEYWYSTVPYNGTALLVSRTLKLKDKEFPVISLVRRVYNPATLNAEGMLIIDINFSRIEEILKKVTVSNNGYFFILDSNGHYVYHPDYSNLGKKVKNGHIAKLGLEESGSKILETDTRDLVTFTHSPNLGWTFFTSVEYQNLTDGIDEIRKNIMWTIFISLGLAYLMGYGFATSLVRPVRRLHRFMKEVEVGNLESRVPVESKDEIGQLSKGFNNTVEKLSKLLDEVYVSKLKETESSLKQKESELKMLQSQINPHFLYNSLETIRGMALEENQGSIAIMSNSLGKLLRYNLKNSSSTVSLGEEIKYCEMYLQVQKFRFEDRFEYKFEIPDWAMNLEVVKFSLQPIVENCFVHAFGPEIRKIKITICILRISQSSFIIRISDTGSGMSNRVLKETMDKIKSNTGMMDGQSIGIINVNQRIIYLFGSEYGITIQSKEGEGTVVDLHLPVIDTSGNGEIG
jgi:two-component system, sensor histidine kinase YesM